MVESILSGQGSFNKEPFFLGAYDQIAHYRGGRFGRAGSFKMRLEYSPGDLQRLRRARSPGDKSGDADRMMELTFEDAQSQPALVMLRITAGPVEVSLSTDELPKIRLKYDGLERSIESEGLSRAMFKGFPSDLQELLRFISSLYIMRFDVDAERNDIPENIPKNIRLIFSQIVHDTPVPNLVE